MPPPLIAAFTASSIGKTETFNSGSSKGNISNYHWDFGDGNTDNSANPHHTFAKDTVYYICLTIYDGSDCSYTYCTYIDLIATGISSVAASDNWNIYLLIPTELTIDNTGINSPLNGIEVYDMLGRLMINESAVGMNVPERLDVSLLAKGMYYIKLKTTNATYVQKVVTQ